MMTRDLSPTFYTPGTSMTQINYHINGTNDYKKNNVILKSTGNSIKSFNLDNSGRNTKVIKRIIRSPTPNKTITRKYINKVSTNYVKISLNINFKKKII
jgi:hypothetical protein